MKVYELAKELDLAPLALVDKLKDLNIQVKSHMSDIGPEDIETARAQLGPKKKTVTTTKKKATTSKAASKTTTTKKKASTTAATTARTRKKAAAEPEAPPAAPVEEPKDAAAPVIRRRTRAGGATTETVIAPSGATTTRTSPNAHPAEELVADEATEETGMDESLEAGAEQQDQSLESIEAEEQQAYADEAGEPEQTVAGAGTEQATSEAAGEAPPAAKAPMDFPKRPVAPRRSILKVVEPTVAGPKVIKAAPKTPPAAAGAAGARPAPAGRGEGRIVRVTKESLDQMVEEETRKKRGAGGGKEGEIRPEDVRFADYRKKEMVFLPKKKRIPLGKELKKTEITTPKAAKRVVEMGDTISVQDFANQMNVKAVEVVRKLMQMGHMANIHATIDYDTAALVAAEFSYEVKNIAFKEEVLLETPEDKPEDLSARPPVVTIMGHVDHGKTSLLDAIRQANVAGGEAGGITQHIGAYTVEQSGKLISFIDTPGHEAFTVMRARGANVTDIVILVVAADDGVMPQTREALSHAKAAGVPIIVAMNKIDKPQANPEKVKQQLSELDLLPEDWGGQTMYIPVSAIQKTNLDQLLEGILLQAEVLDLKANRDARASGTVLEARLEKGRGPVASVLISRGTLRVGDPIVSGSLAGKVKAMLNDKGEQVQECTPGLAVEVLGFEGVPNAGDTFDSTATEADARRISEHRVNQARGAVAATQKVSLDDLFAKIQSGSMKELNIILKADVFGSVEAVRDSLVKLSNDQVKVKVIHSAAGGVTESDVLLASASNAVIIGFNVRPETKARQLAEAEHVDIKCYNIIYELIDEVKKAMTGLLDKKKVEVFLGRAEVRQTFSVPKIGVIAGTSVIDGKMLRGANVRLLRDSRVIYEGKMSSLKRFKDDAKEVATGYECGIGLENYNDLKPGDVIEAYQIEMIAPELNA